METKNAGAPAALVFASPTDTVAAALDMMNESGITQIPVLEDHRSVGSLRESRVLTKLLQNRDLLEAPVSDVMDESFPVLDAEVNIAEIKKRLQKAPAVLIEDFKRITGIITRSDVLELQK
ncbi:MAG: CBS domain-containing protein [Acidobacteriota bacterium]